MSTLVCSGQKCAFEVTVLVLVVVICSWITSEHGPTEHPSINWIISRLKKTGMCTTAFSLKKEVWCIGPE